MKRRIKRRDKWRWWEEAEKRQEHYKNLLEAVEKSDMQPIDKHDTITAIRVLMKPHTGSRSAEEWVRRLTMIETGDEIRVDNMLPCPFCGCAMQLEEVLMIDNRTIRYDPVPVRKHKRGCQLEFTGSAFIGQPETIRAAVEKWNRRA